MLSTALAILALLRGFHGALDVSEVECGNEFVERKAPLAGQLDQTWDALLRHAVALDDSAQSLPTAQAPGHLQPKCQKLPCLRTLADPGPRIRRGGSSRYLLAQLSLEDFAARIAR